MLVNECGFFSARPRRDIWHAYSRWAAAARSDGLKQRDVNLRARWDPARRVVRRRHRVCAAEHGLQHLRLDRLFKHGRLSKSAEGHDR
jgi:hypothetical protein